MREDVRATVRAVRDEEIRLDARVTWEGGDAERFARQAAKEATPSELTELLGGAAYLLAGLTISPGSTPSTGD